ncbi:MAG TPA: ABC transporter ATP-binding protein [Ramlibacter sp.]|jgi:branched-chain amino acid transport system ATP-binding protein
MPGLTELRFEQVRCGYGALSVVHDLGFSLRRGERLGLIGRNGAGKSTTLATAMGLADLHGGRILFDGGDVSKMPTHRRARAGLGYVPQAREIFPSLTVEENLLSALQGGPRGPALEAAYALFPRLRERRANRGGQLSGGEQQMLAVARALVPQPDILLLDEPLEGLAPNLRDELVDAIERLVRERGIGCLLVEQQVDVVLDFSERVIVLERGLPVFQGTSAELRAADGVLNRAIGLDKA